MTDHVANLKSCIRNVAFGEQSSENWILLECSLCAWREPSDGGTVDCDYVDDCLEDLLADQAQILKAVFHLSKMSPTEQTRKSIIAARDVFERLVGAIERAAIVAQIRGANVREPMSPCSTDDRSPTTVSPAFSPCGREHEMSSPVVPKCK